MLKRLYIDNFRCFVNFEYKPERKQLLLGANGSGKSSLLDAVRAVQGFVSEEGGDDFSRVAFQNSKTRWLNLPKQVFEIEAEIEGRQYIYHLEINADGNPEEPVLAESLTVDGNPILLEGGITGGCSKLRSRRDAPNEVRRFVVWLSKDLICLRINPYAMKNAGTFTGPAHPAFDLNNIADWYMQLTMHDSHGMSKLRSSLQEVFDGPASLNFKYTKTGNGDLAVLFGGPDRNEFPFRLMELSEGQRCLIALYMILHFLIAKGKTVFLDEPDNFISLREIQPWLLAAEDAVLESRGQLILISHHPEILNMWAREYGVQFYREENGPVAPPRRFKTEYDDVLQPSEVVARGWEYE